MDSDRRTAKSFAGAALSVAVGTALPWVTTNPGLPPDTEIPSTYHAGMAPGFEGFDVLLLGAVGLVLLTGVTVRRPIHAGVTLAAGLAIAVFPVYYLSTAASLGFGATFVPAIGWYLTVFGGVLLSLVGGFQVSSLRQRPSVDRHTFY